MLSCKSLKSVMERLSSPTGTLKLQCKFLQTLSTTALSRSNCLKIIPNKSCGKNKITGHFNRMSESSFLLKNTLPNSYIQRPGARIYSVILQNPRLFHTTPCRKVIPPVFWGVLRPIAAMMFGRTFRKLWQKLPQEKRDKILHRILGAFGVCSLGLVLYIIVHIEEEPYTKRRRFILFSRQDMRELCKVVEDEMLKDYGPITLPNTHKLHRRAQRVMAQLMNANHDDIIQSGVTSWNLCVINEPNVNNAMVLPNGTVYIFSGIMDTCSSDDQLGIILAHEIAHVLMNHQGEAVSKEAFFSMISIFIITALWAMLQDATAALSLFGASYISALFIHLPFSRLMESEADAVGLNLAAKACLDVRQASVFWDKMALLEELGCQDTPLEFLSTHPSAETRQRAFDELIPEALKLREVCKCHRLSTSDPRILFGRQKNLLKEAKLQGCLSCDSISSLYNV